MNEERYAAKEERRSKKDGDFETLKSLVQRIVEDNEAAKAQAAEEREREAGKPGVDAVLEALQKANQEQSALLSSLAEGWRTESEKQHLETIETVKATAQEQVPYNVQGYLDQFSRALAEEVRMLLGEVGKLREEKRNLQYELGCLMCMRSKYGPGGEFDPDWWDCPPPPGGPGGPPPPGGGPFPPMPEEQPIPAAKPAWRNVGPPQPPKLSKRQRRQQKEAEEAAAGPSGAPADPRIASWATWQPNPQWAPTPASQEAELVAPERGPPGLFGPRSPRDSFMKPM
ncbi:hypothetical protein K439DRAFT_1358317 [Ramaria rubella]|nr:hypothetical protein K439DRAFT_1358317 [Ramaria rubella]